MRRIALSAAIVFAISACVETSAASLPGQTFHQKTRDGWSVSCWQKARTGAGTITGYNECSVLKNNSAASAGISITASPSGRSISAPRAVDPQVCDGRPRAQGVDGVSMVGKTYSQKLAMLAGGRAYFEERQSRWPYCTVTIAGEIPLRGFAEAYQIFDREASKRGW